MNKVVLRRALAVFSLLIALSLAIYTCWAFSQTATQIKVLRYDDYLSESLNFVRQGSERFFEMSVLVLGALWALAIVDREHGLRLREWDLLVMFVVASALFIAFFALNQQYEEVIRNAYLDVAALKPEAGQKFFPDFFQSPHITLYRGLLALFFYAGLMVSGMTAFAIARLR